MTRAARWVWAHAPQILTALTAVAVAVMLYDGLYHLALDQLGWPAWKARLFPLSIDAMVALAYWETTRLHNPWAVGYAWAVVVLGSGESVVAQALHTQWALFGPPHQTPGWAPYLAAAPVLSLGLMLHLLYLGRHPAHVHVTQPAAAPAETPAKPVFEPARAKPAPRRPRPALGKAALLADPHIRALVEEAAAVRKARPGLLDELAGLMGQSRESAKRLVRDHRQATAAPPAEAA